MPDTIVTLMSQSYSTPNLNEHVDWIVFDRSWGAFSEPCATREEALELAGRTGDGAVYKRQWTYED